MYVPIHSRRDWSPYEDRIILHFLAQVRDGIICKPKWRVIAAQMNVDYRELKARVYYLRRSPKSYNRPKEVV